MRITFCDLCDESIPLSDLERGRAVRRKGRSICARCEEAMGAEEASGGPASKEDGDGSAAPPRRSPSVHTRGAGSKPHLVHARSSAGPVGVGLAVALSVVALLFTCGAAVFFLQRLERDSRGLAGLRSRWDAELARVSGGLDARFADASLDARNALRVAQDVGRRLEDRKEEARTATAGSLDELRAEVARLSERLAASERAIAAGVGDPPETAQLERSVADLHREVQALGQELRGAGQENAQHLELPGVSAVPAVPEERRPSWWPHVSDLASTNAGTRWSAVQALGETHDPAVAEHLGVMLKDPDIFVRMATARVLGDLRSIPSIPFLIDALEDVKPSVREAAAVSLRAISAQAFSFDPSSAPAERARRVKAWRDWWKGARDRLLGSR